MNTSVSWDAMMIAVDSSSAGFVWSNMWVSASSCVLYKLSTSLQVSSVTVRHFLSQLTYITFLRSYTLSNCFWQSWAKILMRLLLLVDEDKTGLIHGWLFQHSLWSHHGIFQIPPSIRELSVPVCNADMKMPSESSAKVLLSPWTFWTRFIPSMMQVDGCGIPSANDTNISSCLARVYLLVFFRVPWQLPGDRGNGPSGSASTDLMSNFLLVAISTIWPNNLWSAFRTVSLWVLLATLGLFLELLLGKWVMERLLSESYSFILKVLVCSLSTCIGS